MNPGKTAEVRAEIVQAMLEHLGRYRDRQFSAYDLGRKLGHTPGYLKSLLAAEVEAGRIVQHGEYGLGKSRSRVTYQHKQLDTE